MSAYWAGIERASDTAAKVAESVGAAVKAERERVLAEVERYICTTHFHEDDLLAFIAKLRGEESGT